MNTPNDFPQQRGDGKCILVVDDQESVLDMASIIFELRGYKVLTAINSFIAIETYEKHCSQIHAVLIDFNMPVMDGKELCRVLMEINPKAKIIISSEISARMNELEFRNIGIKYYLTKPFDPAQLLKTVQDAIQNNAPDLSPRNARLAGAPPSFARKEI